MKIFYFLRLRTILIAWLTAQMTMPQRSSKQITALLADWSEGDQAALEQLMPLVYDELRQMARRYISKQPSGHTFQATDLIHEAYLKLARHEEQGWRNRAHFFGVASKAMRHILVDHARAKQSEKRGGRPEMVTLAEQAVSADAKEVLALDDALNTLAKLDERKSRIVELKYFGGITNDEIAEVLGVSTETVKRDWRFARTWLLRELSEAEP